MAEAAATTTSAPSAAPASPAPSAAPSSTPTPTSGFALDGQAPATSAETAETQAPAAQTQDPRHVPYKALKEEREKRKAEAKRAADLEKKLAYLEGQAQARATSAEPKKPLTREEIEAQFFQNPTDYINSRVQDALRQVETQTMQQNINRSEAVARSKWSDYDEMVGVFADMVRQQPALAAELRQQHDPATYAYQRAKLYRELRATGGSIEKLRAKVEAEVRAKVEEEMKRRTAVTTAAGVPKSSAGVAGTGAQKSSAGGDYSLSGLLGKRGF